MLSHVISVIFAAQMQRHIQALGNVVVKKLKSAIEPRVQTHLQSYVHHATQQEAVYQTVRLVSSKHAIGMQLVKLCTMSRTWHAGLSSLVCRVLVMAHTFPSSFS